MKILLLGEFSSLHNNLKKGLIEQGHSVTLASSGDGWKKIQYDLRLPTPDTGSILSKIVYRIRFFKLLFSIENFDVIQFIGPGIVPTSFFPSKWVIKRLRKKNHKIFMLAAGSDYYYWTVSRKQLQYGPFEDNIKYDLKKNEVRFLENDFKKFNTFLANFVDGIIPIMYEYELAYKEFSNLTQVIPIPVDLDNIKMKPQADGEKLLIFHGLSRYGFKGTKYIEEAFMELAVKYSKSADFLIKGKMPINEYLDLMEMTDFIVDQSSSYSLGVNGVFGLAMGKIVFGGAEPESLMSFGINSSPVINIKPDSKDIAKKISQILDSADIDELRTKSRKYAEDVHCCRKVATQYIDTWVKV